MLWEQRGILPITQSSQKCTTRHFFHGLRTPFRFSWMPFISEGTTLGNLHYFIFEETSFMRLWCNITNFLHCTGIQGQNQTIESVCNVVIFLLPTSSWTSLNIHIYSQFLSWSFIVVCTYTKWRRCTWKTWPLWLENTFTLVNLCDKRDKGKYWKNECCTPPHLCMLP